ncbi:LLM class flavin-dependent oxidoreductase [Streptomonospora nanhaiensis]|uniref:LLM class flavin-dependent oxidoreductase n=1 Tax=Streptomonospora nanhaiensis TaxID=1323731 RepID=UPI001C385E91|nr:LLM class flavin-dependent oxidoreductase [Streptomonospora nanhaiensis]MBV2365247.1 LLM class flavin-dependent oxidoreductase [Streptomonospora nanhaiensis]MBX9391898.1 LLM class flavin-dependent oxidoreductase [Streptomonospora nanhaiensis]
MRFGINFFPTVGPAEKPADRYFAECLRLAEVADELGLDHVKTVEHYFHPYGGYSPDPVTFLAAAAARTESVRLVTGAAIPAFTHPLKLAGKLAMLDNISRGRLQAGFGRAFLPDEFDAFGVPMDESRERFQEGVEACRRLWTEEDVRFEGRHYAFGPLTLLPRPYQRPHPAILVAAAFSPESCAAAGRAGHGLMVVPSILDRERLQGLLAVYREGWAASGGAPGAEHVHVSYECYLDEHDSSAAYAAGRAYADNYRAKLAEAVTAWGRTRSDQYQGYERLVEGVKRIDYDASLREDKLLVGTPEEIAERLRRIREHFGEVTVSLHVNSGTTTVERAERTLRVLADRVLPEFTRPREQSPAAAR